MTSECHVLAQVGMQQAKVEELLPSLILNAHSNRGKVTECMCMEFISQLIADSGITVTPSRGGDLKAAEQGLKPGGVKHRAITAFTDFRQTCIYN